MFKKLILAATAILFSVSAFAADSAGNRGSSSFVISKNFSGGNIPMSITQPFRFGYMWDGDLEVGIEYGSADYSLASGNTDATTTFGNQGIYARWFLGNSVNIYTGIQQRTFKGTFTLSDALSNTVDADATISALGATVGIGNQWQMDFGLTIGVDWLFFSMPLSTSVSASIPNETVYTAAEAEAELKSYGDAINVLSSLGMFGITLGFAF